MSEAINLFLRQSIMRGGIPFTLNVLKEHEAKETPGKPVSPVEEAIIDALRRFKAVSSPNRITPCSLMRRFLSAL
jgi:antitoxin component of RelBE/YafQ-DinJ toxin-antitoxin module